MPEITMPRLSDTMEEGTITHWLKKSGDEVKKGDMLAEVETDKATMEIEAYDSGVLEDILVQEGEVAPIGQPIAVIGSGQGTQKQEQSANTEASTAEKQSSPPQDTSTATESTEKEDARPQNESSGAVERKNGTNTQAQPTQSMQVERPAAEDSRDGARIKVSPLARRIAEEHNVDLHRIQGTGPGGRILRDDLEDFLEQQPSAPPPSKEQSAPPPQEEVRASAGVRATPPPDSEVITPSSMQKTIARRLTESKQTIPHFYVSNEIDMTDVLALRQTLNGSSSEGGVKVSVNDLIIKACALALEKFPEVNSSFKDGQFLRRKHINIGIAVDIPAGLVVPVIKDVNIKGVRSIAREAKGLIEKARSGKLTPEDLSGGTFSISNLGMMDVTNFVAVINPPESAILAVASTRRSFVPIDDQPVARDLMPVTISADHRLLYGATVARFLQEVKHLLQNPYTLLG